MCSAKPYGLKTKGKKIIGYHNVWQWIIVQLLNSPKRDILVTFQKSAALFFSKRCPFQSER